MQMSLLSSHSLISQFQANYYLRYVSGRSSELIPDCPYHAKYLPRALLCVKDGIIEWVEEDVEPYEVPNVLRLHNLDQNSDIVRLERGQFLMPGFIDTHTHAPQFPNLGRGGQYELLDWLSKLTFPTEAKFDNKDYARAVYTSVVSRLLNCGTTTCCYFSTAHVSGTEVLAEAVHDRGQRAFIGYCNMDRNAPDFYLNGADHCQSLKETRKAIAFIHALGSDLIHPILTPRFAISCTGELLEGLGDIASEDPKRPLLIQTHISENRSEIDFTAALFPTHSSYAHVYADKGLLGARTILAHGCHLTYPELDLIKKADAGISHCPTSNFHLSSGVAKVGKWINLGIKVGLGTDVSGGYSPSMLTAIQHASIASKVATRISSVRLVSGTPLTPETPHSTGFPSLSKGGLPNATLLHLATLGGAELCNLQDRVGSLEPGKDFDALIVDLRPQTGNPKLWWDISYKAANYVSPSTPSNNDDSFEATTSVAELEDFLEKFFFCGDDRNISTVFVRGNVVGGQSIVKVPVEKV